MNFQLPPSLRAPLAVLGCGCLLTACGDRPDQPGAAASGAPQSQKAPGRQSGIPGAAGAAQVKIQKPTVQTRPDPDVSNFNPALGSRQVLDMAEGEARAESLGELMEKWAFLNPAEAAAWVRTIPQGEFRQEATSELLSEWGRRDPEAALNWLSREGLQTPANLTSLAAAWAKADPSAAAGWAATLTDPDARRGALTGIAGSWAESEPAVAAAWAESLPADEREGPAAMIVQSWAQTDPASAAAWLGAMVQHGDPGAAPVATLVGHWTEKDPGEVSAWLNALPEGAARETAVTVFATSVAEADPVHALLWAMSVKAPQDRNQTVADVCEIWYDAQPEGFRATIVEALKSMPDPLMRRGVYEMLYERDRTFHDSILNLLEHQPAEPAEDSSDQPEPETQIG